MNNSQSILIILFIFVYSLIFADDIPKKIIAIEENLELDQDNFNKNSTQKDNVIVNKVDFYNEEETEVQEIEEVNDLIVVDDIPKEFNDWYGILSSEQGGLGWLMWGNTNNELAFKLLEKTNFSTNSKTILDLTSKLLMSRAQKPREIETSDVTGKSFIKKEKCKTISLI